GARRDRAVEHLGVRAVRVLLEEVVLDGPERVEPDLVAEDRLLERVLVRLVLLAGSERLAHRDLVEQRELHLSAPDENTFRWEHTQHAWTGGEGRTGHRGGIGARRGDGGATRRGRRDRRRRRP